MRVPGDLRRAHAELLAWDVSFLPGIAGLDHTPGSGVQLECRGVPLAVAARWPRSARVAVSVQLTALAAFLFDRGWFPTRRMLRSTRVERYPEGVHLRLSRMPTLVLDGRALRRHNLRLPPGSRLLAGILAPLLRALLPEGLSAWAGEGKGGIPELLSTVARTPRAGDPWRHPDGTGRFLWGRQLVVPDQGVVWVEDRDPDLLSRLETAARLRAAAEGRDLDVALGPLSEEQVQSILAQASARSQDCLVFTTVPVADSVPLALAAPGESVWAVAPSGARPHDHLERAVEVGQARASIARQVLCAGATRQFAGDPGAPVSECLERLGWLSVSARGVLAWLHQAPAGLTDHEVEAVAGKVREPLAELQRLGLAWWDAGVWHSVAGESALDAAMQRALAAALPAESPRRLLALVLAGDDTGDLCQWCRQALERGQDRDVQSLAGRVSGCTELAMLAAEAALGRGRLAEAGTSLARVAPARRDGRWYLLEAWRAGDAGEASLAAEALGRAHLGPVTGRLADRIGIVHAEQLRKVGQQQQAASMLSDVEAGGGRWAAEAALLRASLAGKEGLRSWRRSCALPPPLELLAKALYLRSSIAFGRGSWAAAATGLRAGLRLWRGENLLLLADIHADLGASLASLEHGAAAERHFLLAEQLYARCGSSRDQTLVRPNRAVLACDRLELAVAEDLIAGSRRVRGEVADLVFWLDETELARIDAARCDLAAARERMVRIRDAMARFEQAQRLEQSLAAVSCHLALAEGNLAAARAAADQAEASERELVLAVAESALGVSPVAGLSARWGMTITAGAMAALVRGEIVQGRDRLLEALRNSPREAAMGVARLMALTANGGPAVPQEWDEVLAQAADVLDEVGLHLWRRHLRRGGPDLAGLMTAMDALVHTHGARDNEASWRALARALGLTGLALAADGQPWGGWGQEPRFLAAAVAGVEIRCSPRPGPGVRAVLEFVARHLPIPPPACGASQPPGAGGVLLGASPAMAAVREAIARLAPLPLTVLILGEPGTGKELVAREIHRCSGRTGGWEAVNCAGFPEGLLESELFGVARGAFTGADRDRPGLVESTDGGTLFLDEIGEMPLTLQAKLLRLLQEKEVRRVGAVRTRRVDVRFVAATNRDLEAAVAEGSFRRDLFDRLSVATIHVAPLRERQQDVPALARALVERQAAEYGRPGVTLSGAALDLLAKQAWPGNVRELESVLIRAVISAHPGEVLGRDRFAQLNESPVEPDDAIDGWFLAQRRFALAYFRRLLALSGGNRTRAAELAGISRQALNYQMRRLGVQEER